MRTHVDFMLVIETGAIYEVSRVNVKIERVSSFTFARNLSYIASFVFYARNFYARTHMEITGLWIFILKVDFHCRVIFFVRTHVRYPRFNFYL